MRPGFYFESTMSDVTKQAPSEEFDPGSDPELRQQIEESLDLIRPYLMADGGSVRLLNVTPDMVVELELLGACGTCPMSTMTLRAGIEQALKRSVPQISRVEAVNAPTAY
jgi:Fe-S cluster biogenesis protein NfuA